MVGELGMPVIQIGTQCLLLCRPRTGRSGAGSRPCGLLAMYICLPSTPIFFISHYVKFHLPLCYIFNQYGDGLLNTIAVLCTVSHRYVKNVQIRRICQEQVTWVFNMPGKLTVHWKKEFFHVNEVSGESNPSGTVDLPIQSRKHPARKAVKHTMNCLINHTHHGNKSPNETEIRKMIRIDC